MDAVKAEEEFRWGVKAYNNGFFNKAILSFEKSLTFKPENPKTKEWLGKAYYRSGFEEAALTVWQSLLDAGEGSAVLQNRIDTLRFRRGFGKELAEKGRYVIASQIESEVEGTKLFSRPTAVSPRPDGSFYVVAFGSNEVLLFDTNGALKTRLRGGLEGFDHPFDILDTGTGTLFVTEFEGNRIAKCNSAGYITQTFGGTGRGEGKLIGPQYLTTDGQGYLYVTDWGNRRVCKFDYEGNFVLSFGKRSSYFEGFSSPTGIIVHQERVFVADSTKKCIFVFDLSGNYLTTLAQGQLNGPEDIALLEEGVLLIADTNRIVRFNIEQELVSPVSNVEGRGEKVLSAALDANGNLLAIDFNTEGIYLLTELNSLYSGLEVSVDSVFSDRFPEVLLTVKVENRLGEPIVGLTGHNFIITEDHLPVSNLEFEYATHRAETADVAMVIEKSPALEKIKNDAYTAVTAITGALRNRGQAALIAAEEKPVLESKVTTDLETPLQETLSSRFSEQWSFDLSVRMGVSEIIPSRNKRAVVFISTGELGNDPFSQYSLVELMQYMRNNEVRFYCIYLQKNSESEELEYLCRETGGESFFLYQPEGIQEAVDVILEQRSGMYVFKYYSSSPTDFGKEFIPVEVETFLFKRSGRDESGYYAPLEF